MHYSIFGKRSVNQLENLLKTIKAVESTHKGLGVATSFNLLCVLGGQSNFNVGSSGKGKTHVIFSIINACQRLPNTLINNWNAMTYYELLEKIGEKYNTNLLWTVEEWSMLSQYHRDLLMAIASKVQTDNCFERLVMKGAFTAKINIVNCRLVLMIAIQPYKFKKLMRESESWNSLASDRFTKFMFVNPLQADTKDFPPKFELPECVFQSKKFDFKPNTMLVEMFNEHLTQGRAELATVKFQEAWCKLNDKNEFTKVDAIAFRTLYSPYLELYPLMIKVTDPEHEESFHTGPFRILEYFMRHYNDNLTIGQLERAFHMVDSDDQKAISERTIYRHLQVLEKKGIVQAHNPDWSHYSLSDRYTKYFETYRTNWS